MKRRMVSVGPLSETGGMTTWIRDPSSSRASTIGELSSMRRPTRLTMRSMTCISWSAVSNRYGVSERRPARSIQISSGPLTMISVIVGSAMSRSRGPKPSSSLWIRVTVAIPSSRSRGCPSAQAVSLTSSASRSRTAWSLVSDR